MAVKDRLGQLGTFCALTPVVDEPGLRAELDRWPAGSGSPFARLEATHFARFVVLDGLQRESLDQPAEPLPCPYLMFSAFFDGAPDAYLEALCAALPDEADAVWRHCRGHPGHPAEHGAAFREWLREHRVPATAIFAAYPDAGVADVRDALAFRERFRAFAFDPARRRRAQADFATFAEREG